MRPLRPPRSPRLFSQHQQSRGLRQSLLLSLQVAFQRLDPLLLVLRRLLDDRLRRELEPFLRAMHRRLDRDRTRVHAYHDDLRSASLKRLAALAGRNGEKADADRRRESLRAKTIEHEYRAKLDDLRHNYALRVSAEWVQALEFVRAGAAPGSDDSATKRRKTDPVRLASLGPAG